MSSLSHRVRQARRSAKLSQAEVATLIGINRSAVAQWESVIGTRPSTENQAKLALVTSVSYEWLATGRGRMHGTPAPSANGETAGLLINQYAHDESEERLLGSFRRLDVRERHAVVVLMESLAAGRRPE